MRFLFYSPDSYGLGHVRRTLSVAGRLLRDVSGSSALVLTGAPRAHYFRYPARCDYVKLPSVGKDSRGRYVSREIDLSIADTVGFRGRLIDEAASSFRPDVLVVDHAPTGLCGEILPALTRLGGGSPSPLRVLGLRDVIDEPAAVRAAWERDGVLDVLRRSYDLILVYGQREVYDVVAAYGMPEDVASKTEFVGYVPRRPRRAAAEADRARYAPRTGRLVLVTLGGGGDGNLLLRAFLAGYEALGAAPPFEVLALTGPLMSPRKRGRFQAWASRLAGVSVEEHSDRVPELMHAADAVVSMAGYNTICELACAGARAVVVPRVFPRMEQLLRASLLAERGVLRCVSPERAHPRRLVEEVLALFERPRPPRGWGLAFTGLDGSVAALTLRLGQGPTRRAAGALPAREIAP